MDRWVSVIGDVVPQNVSTPQTAPEAAPIPVPTPENKGQESQRILEDKSNLEPVKTEPGSQPPAAEPKPALEGGPK